MTKEKHGYIYYRGVHVRELVRASIRILKDTWIANHPTNKVLHAPLNIDEEMMVSELLDPDLQWWDRALIMQNFNQEDADAILRVPFSRRYIPDSPFWLHNKNGKYLMKLGYHVARQLAREEKWVESSNGVFGGKYGRTYGSDANRLREKKIF